MKDGDLVPVASFLHQVDAAIAQGVLQAAGIESFIADDYLSGVAPHYAYGTGVRLLVRSSELEAARNALEAPAADDVEELAPEDAPTDPVEPPEDADEAGPPASPRPVQRTWVILLAVTATIAGLVIVARHRDYRAALAEPREAPACVAAWSGQRWDDALDSCQALVRKNPGWAWGHAYLSMTLTALGRHEEAIEAARRMSGNDFGWCYLARALDRGGSPGEARDALRTFGERLPDYTCSIRTPSGVHPVICPEGECLP